MNFPTLVAEASNLGWKAGRLPAKRIIHGGKEFRYVRSIFDPDEDDFTLIGWHYKAEDGQKLVVYND